MDLQFARLGLFCYRESMSLKSLRPILTVRQIGRVSNILDNAGQVVLGVAVLSPVIGGVDTANIKVVVLGLFTTLFCWLFSIALERRRS